jgi:two-component system, OmpR family, sensor histidine kinase TctE
MSNTGRLSLRRQLLLWLLVPQLVLWAGGGLLAYRFALAYVEKSIDQSLTQSVRALARQVKPIGSGLLIDFPKAAQDVLEQDPKDRLSYMVSSPPGKFVLGNQNMPQPEGEPSAAGVPRLYRGLVEGQPQRIVSLDVNYGEADSPQTLRVQVGKSLTAQQRVARELVADMMAPLLALGLLLSLLVYGGIRRGLAPLTRLTAQLEDRAVDEREPIESTEAPSEVHALVQAINGLLEEVAHHVHQEKRFLDDAAHQLRTPLAGLISQVELAQQATRDPTLSERLAKVHTGAQRSAHLVHQLLTLARTENRAHRETLDLAALAREVARDWTPRALAAGMDMGYEGLSRQMIKGDALQLREALSNLIDNALRYTPSGSTITLRVQRSASGATLAVEDDGPGMNPSELAHVFQRFWRGNQQPGGCGLGLAIVREIARRHGGDALVVSLQPHGLRVELQLPDLQPAAD